MEELRLEESEAKPAFSMMPMPTPINLQTDLAIGYVNAL